jgi:CSLREA domain-containing protein
VLTDARDARTFARYMRSRHLFLFACLLATPLSAQAKSFTVTSTIDAVDAVPGDGVCATAANQCTLRAAIQEANATPRSS